MAYTRATADTEQWVADLSNWLEEHDLPVELFHRIAVLRRREVGAPADLIIIARSDLEEAMGGLLGADRACASTAWCVSSLSRSDQGEWLIKQGDVGGPRLPTQRSLERWLSRNC